MKEMDTTDDEQGTAPVKPGDQDSQVKKSVILSVSCICTNMAYNFG